MLVIYSTILTEGFAPQALALARSIVKASPSAEVLLFCLDAGSARVLEEIIPERCTIIPFESFATGELRAAKEAMRVSAFCWFSKPLIIKHAMVVREGEWFCYVDSDMMMFSDPAPRFVQARDRSVVITPHAFRYAPFIGTEHHFGAFNAGFIAFRNTTRGKELLDWWKDKCLDRCPAEPEPDSFGDQKYVEDMSHRFRDDVSVGFPFTNCAPWNIGRDVVEVVSGVVRWRNSPVLIFHFQGLRLLTGGWVDLYADEFALSSSVRRYIYRPYVAALRNAIRDINRSKAGLSFASSTTASDRLHRIFLTMLGRRNTVYWP